MFSHLLTVRQAVGISHVRFYLTLFAQVRSAHHSSSFFPSHGLISRSYGYWSRTQSGLVFSSRPCSPLFLPYNLVFEPSLIPLSLCPVPFIWALITCEDAESMGLARSVMLENFDRPARTAGFCILRKLWPPMLAFVENLLLPRVCASDGKPTQTHPHPTRFKPDHDLSFLHNALAWWTLSGFPPCHFSGMTPS